MNPKNRKSRLVWLAAILLCLGLAIEPLLKRGSTPLLPDNLGRLDPQVASLIEGQVKQIEANPDTPESRGNLCLMFEANTLWEDARRCFAMMSSLAPKEMLWRYHLAIATRQTGNFQQALDMMKILADEYPSFAPLQQRLGEALLEIGDLGAAETAFRLLIDQSPKAPDGYTGLSGVLLAQKDYAGAARLLEHAVALDPKYPLTRYRLGLAYRGLGRQEEAIREMALGLNASPRTLPDPLSPKIEIYAVNLTAQQNKAAGLLQMGRAQEATAILEPLITFHPENLTVLNNLAIAYMRQGQFDQSHAVLTRALAVNDRKFSTYLNLTSLALRMGQLDLALEYADSAVERAPDISKTYFIRAQVLANLSRHDEALVSLDSALRLDATDPQIHTFIADLSLHLKRLEKAGIHYRDAVTLQPTFLPAQLGLSKVYLQQGRIQETKATLDVARRIAPNHPQVLALEKQLKATGQ